MHSFGSCRDTSRLRRIGLRSSGGIRGGLGYSRLSSHLTPAKFLNWSMVTICSYGVGGYCPYLAPSVLIRFLFHFGTDSLPAAY